MFHVFFSKEAQEMVNNKTKEITLTALFSEALPVNQSLIEKLWANQNTYTAGRECE